MHYCALNGDAGTLRAFVDLANICSAELSLGTTLGGGAELDLLDGWKDDVGETFVPNKEGMGEVGRLSYIM